MSQPHLHLSPDASGREPGTIVRYECEMHGADSGAYGTSQHAGPGEDGDDDEDEGQSQPDDDEDDDEEEDDEDEAADETWQCEANASSPEIRLLSGPLFCRKRSFR